MRREFLRFSLLLLAPLGQVCAPLRLHAQESVKLANVARNTNKPQAEEG
jgi:hypothetical protein